MSNREAAAASERPLPPMNPVPSMELSQFRPGERAVSEQACRNFARLYAEEALLADRAASAPQAVRVLTPEELESVVTPQMKVPYYAADLIQRKFCEVNGIVPLAPQDSTKEGGK